MFAALAPYKLLLQIIAAVLLLSAVVYAFNQFVEHHQQIGYDRRVAEDNAQALKDQEAARKVDAANAKRLEDAQNANTLQNQKINTLVAALAASSGSLRGVANTLVSDLSNASVETARKTATAFASVFQDCTGKYASMAEIADRHVADIVLYKQSWPSQDPTVDPAK